MRCIIINALCEAALAHICYVFMDNVCCGGSLWGFISIPLFPVKSQEDQNKIFFHKPHSDKHGWCLNWIQHTWPSEPLHGHLGKVELQSGSSRPAQSDSWKKKNTSKNTSLLNETSLPLRAGGDVMCEWRKWLLWRSVLTALWFLKCSFVRLCFESSLTVVSAQIFTTSLCLLAFPQCPEFF